MRSERTGGRQRESTPKAIGANGHRSARLTDGRGLFLMRMVPIANDTNAGLHDYRDSKPLFVRRSRDLRRVFVQRGRRRFDAERFGLLPIAGGSNRCFLTGAGSCNKSEQVTFSAPGGGSITVRAPDGCPAPGR